MNIQGISGGNSPMRVPETAAVKVMDMALSNQKQQMQGLAKLLDSSVFTDPEMGNRVNILA